VVYLNNFKAVFLVWVVAIVSTGGYFCLT